MSEVIVVIENLSVDEIEQGLNEDIESLLIGNYASTDLSGIENQITLLAKKKVNVNHYINLRPGLHILAKLLSATEDAQDPNNDLESIACFNFDESSAYIENQRNSKEVRLAVEDQLYQLIMALSERKMEEKTKAFVDAIELIFPNLRNGSRGRT